MRSGTKMLRIASLLQIIFGLGYFLLARFLLGEGEVVLGDMSGEDALMTVDMMSTGFYGVEQADVQFGDTVVVFGIGPVGLMAIAGAALRGAGRIIGIGIGTLAAMVGVGRSIALVNHFFKARMCRAAGLVQPA